MTALTSAENAQSLAMVRANGRIDSPLESGDGKIAVLLAHPPEATESSEGGESIASTRIGVQSALRARIEFQACAAQVHV